ncbi:MAG: hypothetical protein ACSLE3_02635 [Microbacteriaceae bacterium]
MRRLVMLLVSTVAATSGVIVATPGPTYADTVCQQINPATGECLIYVEVPGDPSDPGDGGDGPKDSGSGASCYWDGTDLGITKPPPGPVPCSSEFGYWSNGYLCYISLLDPQPPTGDPMWQGHESGDGAIYNCYQPQTDILALLWSATPPPNSGAGPTPGEVAQIAIEQMGLRAIDIGITPEPIEGSIGLVGMPVWLWAANPDAHSWGPITATASAGGVTVIATATARQVVWDLGDGTQVTCTNPGTPYQASYGKAASPDCGHVYNQSSATQPGGRYTVSATSQWVITWEGAGQTGTIVLNGLTRTAAIAVGEAQVLVH